MKFLNSSLLSGLIIFISSLFVVTAAAQPNDFIKLTVSAGWDEIEGFMWDSTGQQYVWEKKVLCGWLIQTELSSQIRL